MDKNLENIVNRVANRNSVTPIKVKLALEIFFKNQKMLMQRDDMPTIMIHGLGRFVANENKIKRKLIKLKKEYKEGLITEEEFKKDYSRFSQIFDRIQVTKHIRND